MAKEYLYMKKWEDLTYVITYKLGAYYVARMFTKPTGGIMLLPFDRKYKTVSGASRFLNRLNRNDLKEYAEPKQFYGTEEFIKAGNYLKGDN